MKNGPSRGHGVRIRRDWLGAFVDEVADALTLGTDLVLADLRAAAAAKRGAKCSTR